jgi:hypothetical protein
MSRVGGYFLHPHPAALRTTLRVAEIASTLPARGRDKREPAIHAITFSGIRLLAVAPRVFLC